MNFNPKFLTRQSDIIHMDALAMPIEVVGAGAIGSHTAIALARMGFGNMKVWDFDEVSDVNMNNQGYSWNEIGRKKAMCLKQRIADHVGFQIKADCRPYTSTDFGGLVIMAVDSMEVRKQIWNGSQNSKLVIDGRMAAEYIKMYAMNPRDEEDRVAYEKTLYSDADARPESCTAKSTIYTAYLISGMIANVVKDFVMRRNYIRVLNWDIQMHTMEQYVKERTY